MLNLSGCSSKSGMVSIARKVSPLGGRAETS
jgi:hypothetical protein